MLTSVLFSVCVVEGCLYHEYVVSKDLTKERTGAWGILQLHYQYYKGILRCGCKNGSRVFLVEP